MAAILPLTYVRGYCLTCRGYDEHIQGLYCRACWSKAAAQSAPQQQQQYACPSQDAQQQGEVKHAQVYWRHFWNAQRMTRTHLFAYREQGYATKSPEEGKTLCGESIPDYYHTIENAGDVCKRCKRIAEKASAPKSNVGTCEKCGRANRTLTNTGTEAFPYHVCGTCQHREERRINTKEMYGRGRRGY